MTMFMSHGNYSKDTYVSDEEKKCDKFVLGNEYEPWEENMTKAIDNK